MLRLDGIIERITYRNEDNGYTVLRLNTEDGEITAVGVLLYAQVGLKITVEGQIVYHETYGEQLDIENVEFENTLDESSVEAFLKSGQISNIGPKTAERIIEAFGVEALDILENEPERYLEIKGIGKATLQKIVDSYAEKKDIRKSLVSLSKFGLGPSLTYKIINKYGDVAATILEEDPYRLIDDIDGIGFKLADEIAKKSGIKPDDPNRYTAALAYVLNLAANNGHCYLPSEELIAHTSAMINADSNELRKQLRDLGLKENYKLEKHGREIRCYIRKIYRDEKRIAHLLIKLLKNKYETTFDIEKLIEQFEKRNSIKLNEEQIEAVKEVFNNSLMIITGGPGTGKTTIIKAIIEVAKAKGLEIKLAAPTGRAAKRMSQATNHDAETIHRLLEYSPNERYHQFGRNQENPIDCDLLIIDEASMLDTGLCKYLLEALDLGTRLIFIGDIDQLPSVGAGNVLKDLINSKLICVEKLKHIYRQGDKSMIVENAHKINSGRFPIVNGKDTDFFMIKSNDKRDGLNTVLELVTKRLPNFYGLDSYRDIQILTPMKKGEVGVFNLNRVLQDVLNPEGDKSEILVSDKVFRTGDKIMQIRNNYDALWIEYDKNGRYIAEGEGIYNGDIGYILGIDTIEGVIKADFDGKIVMLKDEMLRDIVHSYATTVHKSQGSEFRAVIMPIFDGPKMLMTRNLLYTAITRAKDIVVLVGTEKMLKFMIRNNFLSIRYSSLDKRLREYKILEDILDE
ncbi:MAG: ATP-dependent RecD-like DNA helicase [Tissierellia bacterium]|nr:ATP-dependent RecD-like DNA helicase [Tissierellia bacterium]